MPRGGTRIGAGRPKGRGNQTTARNRRLVSELAREHTGQAIKTLVEMMRSSSDQVRVQAACALLDRGYGRPPVQLDVATQGRVEVIYRTEEEFRQALIRRGFPAGLLPPPLTTAAAEVADESQD